MVASFKKEQIPCIEGIYIKLFLKWGETSNITESIQPLDILEQQKSMQFCSSNGNIVASSAE